MEEVEEEVTDLFAIQRMPLSVQGHHARVLNQEEAVQAPLELG